ncbi:MAG: SPASM domain-containing protein [bacterium]|nr:SPASM domain-containing protein [bacterium]
MSPVFFEKVLAQLRLHTKELALHIMGAPLTLSNLADYLDLTHRYGFAVILTTSGYYLKKTPFDTLFHQAVRQVNISLNSYNKNQLNLSFNTNIDAILTLCAEKLARHAEPFINLRLWNFDDAFSERDLSSMIFKRLESFFNIPLDADELYEQRPKSIRLAPKVLLNLESYFQWPSLKASHNSDGSCYGLKSHIEVLADGTVMPCCLDGDGVIALGNLHDSPLNDILSSPQAKAVEELCRRCSYKDRFSFNRPGT